MAKRSVKMHTPNSKEPKLTRVRWSPEEQAELINVGATTI